jgi:MFS family permease
MRSSPVPITLVNGAALLSATGNGITIVTLPWLVLELTGSATATAIVAGAATVPLVLASVFSGTMVDRIGRRPVSLLSDLFSAASVAAIPLCASTVGLSVALLSALAFVGAMFDPAGVTARKSMIPEAATRAKWTLDSANSTYEAGYNTGYLVGPGIGGILIATIGAINAQWVTAALFGGAILAVFVLRLEGAGKPTAQAGPLWAETRDGLRFVWDSRLLRALALLDMAIISTSRSRAFSIRRTSPNSNSRSHSGG